MLPHCLGATFRAPRRRLARACAPVLLAGRLKYVRATRRAAVLRVERARACGARLGAATTLLPHWAWGVPFARSAAPSAPWLAPRERAGALLWSLVTRRASWCTRWRVQQALGDTPLRLQGVRFLPCPRTSGCARLRRRSAVRCKRTRVPARVWCRRCAPGACTAKMRLLLPFRRRRFRAQGASCRRLCSLLRRAAGSVSVRAAAPHTLCGARKAATRARRALRRVCASQWCYHTVHLARPRVW